MEEVKTISGFPSGIVKIPSSKSYGHRALICAALAAKYAAPGSDIINITMSEDIEATLGAISALGCEYTQTETSVKINGWSGGKSDCIGCGESGSTLRFLVPIAALDETETVFTGRGRLMERPMDVYLDAGISLKSQSGKLAVKGPLRPGSYRLPGNVSSQFISGLLFALPLLEGDSEIILTSLLESSAYVEMTIEVMRVFGVEIEINGQAGYKVRGGQRYSPAAYSVEGDYSQAAFFLVSAALGRDVKCAGLNPESIQGDRAILDILAAMGQEISFENGCVSVKPSPLKAIELDVRNIPDLAPPAAVLMCFAQGTSRIINAGRLRIKESDRLSAIADSLGRLGAKITEGDDFLVIEGQEKLAGGTAYAHNDHRIAMALAAASIRCGNPVAVSGFNCVNKSYPGFWGDFEREARHG